MKPFDFGAEGVTGSVDANGRIIALNFYHPQHSYVTLTAADPFPESERYNPTAVRAYRAGLIALDGFGIRFDAPVIGREAKLREAAIPENWLKFGAGDGLISTIACAQGAAQIINAPPRIGLRWGGRLMLQRCAYSQLTEGGPLPMPPLKMRVLCEDGLLIIHNPELGAAVAVAGLEVECETAKSANPVELDFALRARGSVTVAYGVGLNVETAKQNAHWLYEYAGVEYAAAVNGWQKLWSEMPSDPLAQRGIAYGLMMAIPVGEGMCILTDHMLLPLAWNRDAYFVARALLSAGQHEVARRHLLWTFETATRINGAWARCYTANGQVKDAAYQLDQQLYPLLELAEYVLETGDQATAERLRRHVTAALDALEARRAPDSLLFPTEETPADDPIDLPYPISSHILMWHTLNKLNVLGMAGAWAEQIAPLHETIQRAFITELHGKPLYAYATDGAGRYHFYHDANDFPLALAVAWGFVPANDPTWRNTVDFAFSDANKGGVYGGRLGSVHTPAPWALGDVQEMLIARALGDSAREEQARVRLHATAQPDGSLPEAYNPETGAVVSRHWFAWTNAALACTALGAFEPRT